MLYQLGKPGTKWTLKQGTTEKVSFPHMALSRYAQAWYSFICATLMPTRHQNAVTKYRALLLYAIMTGAPVDVGMTIRGSIIKTLKGSTIGALTYASLITGLYRQAGVQWSPDELHQSPILVIDHATIVRYKVWEGGESHPRGEGFILNEQRFNAPPDMQEQQDEPTATDPSDFDASIQTLHRRLDQQDRRMNKQFDTLAQRMDAMMAFNTQFASTLLGIFSANTSTQVQFPVYGDIPTYPPQDSPDEEESTSSDQGSPQF